MHGNRLTFSRSGTRSKRWGVSPLLFPQRNILNGYFLADERELPTHGLAAQVLIFDFGFSDPSLQVGAMDMQFFPLTVAGNFLALGITGISDVPPSQNVSTPAAGACLAAQLSLTHPVNIDRKEPPCVRAITI